MNWRINSPGLTYDCGDGNVIYFDTASGDTHLISDFAAHLIRQIADHSPDTSELMALIAPDTQ